MKNKSKRPRLCYPLWASHWRGKHFSKSRVLPSPQKSLRKGSRGNKENKWLGCGKPEYFRCECPEGKKRG
jgi:hypothetical protein